MIDAKAKIMDAAERLFGETGFAATSLRQITREAGVNLAGVNYHFGSKEELFRAVLLRRLDAVSRERLALLDACEAAAGGGPAPLEKILDAFLAPALRQHASDAEGGAVFMKLMGRCFLEVNEPFLRILQEAFAETQARFVPALSRALPGLPPEDLAWRIHFMIGAMAHTMAGAQWIRWTCDGPCEAPDEERAIERLVSFVAAGMRAPAPTFVKGGTP